MSSRLINAEPSVQSLPNLTAYVQVCTFYSLPSGSILVRTIPQADFEKGGGKALMDSLSDAVESILEEDFVKDATGVNTIDASGLIQDNVDFTVEYVPTYPTPGEITGLVRIPVNVLTADSAFGNFLEGGSAAERLNAEYVLLKQLAGE